MRFIRPLGFISGILLLVGAGIKIVHLTKRRKRAVEMLRSVAHSIYHEAPNDIMELIVTLCSDLDEEGYGRGGMNALRLASKRLKQVVESWATRLTHGEWDGTESLPILCLRRCKRIGDIICYSEDLTSLEGCPAGLKSLCINGHSLENLEPLRRCTQLESLEIMRAIQISDLSPLASCKRLKTLRINNSPATDLSPLSSLQLLEVLELFICSDIKSLSPLSGLKNLRDLSCIDIDPETSLLPLLSCAGLKELMCSPNAVDLDELRRKLPELVVY